MPRRLYLFLEGNDDERFFSHVLLPLLIRKYSDIRFIQYAEDQPKETNKFLKSISSSGDEVIFVKDIHDAPCVTASKMKVTSKYKVNKNDIAIVVKEIECWYLCGLDSHCCRKLGIDRRLGNTDDMTKEDFDSLGPSEVSHIEFMQQILEKYDIDTGRHRNQSLRYFLRKWVD